MRYNIKYALKIISILCLFIHSICCVYADYDSPEPDLIESELSGSNGCAVYSLSASSSIVYVSVRSASYSNWSFNGYLYDSLDGTTALSFNNNNYSDTVSLYERGYRRIYLYGTITNTSTNQSCSIDPEGGINISHYY